MKTARRILKNMFSLTVAEIANKGIMTIAIAYLARALSPEGFGIIGFADSYIVYFIFFASLGFEIVGTREIAKNKNDLNKHVNSIFTIRTCLAVLSYFALLVFVYYLEKPLIVKYIWLIAGLKIFANAILLNWVFQAVERMEVIAIRQVLTSVMNLVGIFLLVSDIGDTIIAVAVISGSMLINSLWLVVLYIKLYGGLKFSFDFTEWLKLLKPAIPIGMSFFVVTIYNNLNLNMLGFMRGDYETGLYTAAFKIMLLAIVPSGILQMAFFPNFSRRERADERDSIMKKYSLLTFLSGSFIAFSFFVFSEPLIYIFAGSDYSGSVEITRYLMITLFIAYINITYSSPLFAWNKEKYVMYSTIAGGLTILSLNIFMIPAYGATGAAISTIFSEIVVLCGLGMTFYKTTKKLYLGNLLKYSAISLLSCAAGYLMLILGLNTILAGILCCFIFVLINFLFKTVTIEELRGYFSK